MRKKLELEDVLPNYQEMGNMQIVYSLLDIIEEKEREIFGLKTSLRNRDNTITRMLGYSAYNDSRRRK